MRPSPFHGVGTQNRDFISIHDIVQANLLAAQADAVGVSINVGPGSNTTIRDLAELIVDITDSDSDITHVDRPLDDVNQSRANISRVRELLGCELRISHRGRLSEFVDWYRNAGRWTAGVLSLTSYPLLPVTSARATDVRGAGI